MGSAESQIHHEGNQGMKAKRNWFLAVILFAASITGYLYWKSQQQVILRLGVFSGSNWDVPNPDSYSLLDDTISSFEAAHPGVKVVYQSGIRPEEYEEYIAQQILHDTIPDVMFLPSNMFSTLADNGTLQNLHQMMEQDETFSTDVYYETSLMEGNLNDTFYALPYESVPNLMFVNKTLLEQEHIELPDNDWTWDDFYTICKAVTKDVDEDGVLDRFGYYGYTWEDAVYSNGAKIYEEESNAVTLDDERIIEATSFMRKLVSLHSEKVTSEMFDKGQVVFCPMNYSDYRTYMPYPWRVKKYSNFEWDCITMPKGPQGGNTSSIDTLMLGMSARSSHQHLAWEFMKTLSSEAYQTALVETSQGVSVLKQVMQSQEVIDTLKKDNPGNSTFEMTVLDDVMKHGIAIRKTESYEQIMSSAQAQINTLLENDSDIENALILLQRQLNTMLQK